MTTVLSAIDRNQKTYESVAEAIRVIGVDTLLKQRIENDANGFPIYIGLAVPGTATSSAAWCIRKMTYSGASVTQVDFADGTNEFTKVWDDRATYSY